MVMHSVPGIAKYQCISYGNIFPSWGKALGLVPARCILDADESVPVKVDKNVVADTYAEERGIEERSMELDVNG
ncbi:hypothetical protein BOTCAL_0049g00050 [Botryotinia calthae]|uniref:Uncharacterized protein n=1 Tax=Botryotinia calthae TaxID=38488 RepID=A0A4Y8DDN7_9HELO|nr:hypothetical protein BOTCAL_0049g00050 [Botryotinia calthae]